jgi:hypothetical protein
MPDNDESLGDQQTYEGGAQPADSSERSLGDQSTFGGDADCRRRLENVAPVGRKT